MKHITACFSKVFGSARHKRVRLHLPPCPSKRRSFQHNLLNRQQTREKVNGAAVAIDTDYNKPHPPLSKTLSAKKIKQYCSFSHMS
jgi:hypothetical protein